MGAKTEPRVFVAHLVREEGKISGEEKRGKQRGTQPKKQRGSEKLSWGGSLKLKMSNQKVQGGVVRVSKGTRKRGKNKHETWVTVSF